MNLYDILDKCNIDKNLIKVTLNKKRPGYPFDPELELIKYKEGKIDNTTHGRHIAWCGARRGSKFKKNDIIIQLIKQEDSEDIYKCGTVSKVISVTKNNNFIKDSDDPLLSNKWIIDIIPESDIVSIALEGKYFKNRSSKKSNFDYQFKYGDPYIDDFELIDNTIKFPGKENLNCTFKELENYIDLPEWRACLKDVYAVYLITDNSNGKMYVGSATAKDGGLYSRWKNYINTGNGGNIEFLNLTKDYISNNFSYTILEEFGKSTKKSDVIKIESKWKEKLHTRDFGYNRN